jgi:cytosine/adenosine deaminase-related metal-dependent hydrolase
MICPPVNFVLSGGRVALNARVTTQNAIAIQNGRVYRNEQQCTSSQLLPVIDVSGYIVLPGLINAHDHLEFSLFPRLGSGPYPNWQKWANDIYQPFSSPLRELLSVPKSVRLWFGGIRNLLCGVTTVAEHNPYIPEIFGNNFPVKVLPDYGWAHSLKDAETLRKCFALTPHHWPFFLHFAEGTDDDSIVEFDRLASSLPLSNRLVLIHGVGALQNQLALLASAETALVWCPSSNLFTLGKTLSLETITSYPFLVLCSDSPLTAIGDLLDELRLAHEMGFASADLLYEMVTTRAASALWLKSGEGRIHLQAPADLILLRDEGRTPAETLVSASYENIECVICDGAIRLLSPSFAKHIPSCFSQWLEEVQVGHIRRFLPRPIKTMIQQVETHTNHPCLLMDRRSLS